jgi:anaerobic selenocysteine-containing dehydrogenase
MYAKGKNVIMCWAMGITQHRHSVPTIQEIANLMLLRGNIGRPGAGLCPVRGHSNVQGDRTMGINERPPVAFLDALERRFQFKVPRDNGHNVVEAIHAMAEGRAKVFIGLGGNFAQATPDSPRTFQALSNCDLTVQISTKLNRSHLAHGKDALILPCLGRTDIDIQTEGPQAVTVEDSFSMVHASNGQLQPLSNQMRSEPAICRHRRRHAGQPPVDWNWLVADYRRIRDLIADTIPGFKDFNEKIKNPGVLPRQQRRRAQVEHRVRPGQFPPERAAQGPGARTHPRHRRTAGPDPAIDALPRSVQHHHLWPRRPLSRGERPARRVVRQRSRHHSPGLQAGAEGGHRVALG